MGTFDEALARRVDGYIERLFAVEDEALAENRAATEAAGLPSIAVTPTLGKLLYLVARLVSARRVLEVGTLGGYSTTWLARALPADGRLVTLELDAAHARVARENLERAAVAGLVDIRVGPALASLQAMARDGEPPFDLVFIDADKVGYVDYLDWSVRLSRPGTVILADNVIRDGRVLDEVPEAASDRGIKRFNEALAAHPRLESLILPIVRDDYDGLSVSLVR